MVCSRYQPDTLAELRGVRSSMISSMRAESDDAIQTDDPRLMQQALEKIEERGFSAVCEKEVQALRRRQEQRVRAIDEEIRSLLQVEDYTEVGAGQRHALPAPRQDSVAAALL